MHGRRLGVKNKVKSVLNFEMSFEQNLQILRYLTSFISINSQLLPYSSTL